MNTARKMELGVRNRRRKKMDINQRFEQLERQTKRLRIGVVVLTTALEAVGACVLALDRVCMWGYKSGFAQIAAGSIGSPARG